MQHTVPGVRVLKLYRGIGHEFHVYAMIWFEYNIIVEKMWGRNSKKQLEIQSSDFSLQKVLPNGWLPSEESESRKVQNSELEWNPSNMLKVWCDALPPYVEGRAGWGRGDGLVRTLCQNEKCIPAGDPLSRSIFVPRTPVKINEN